MKRIDQVIEDLVSKTHPLLKQDEMGYRVVPYYIVLDEVKELRITLDGNYQDFKVFSKDGSLSDIDCQVIKSHMVLIVYPHLGRIGISTHYEDNGGEVRYDNDSLLWGGKESEDGLSWTMTVSRLNELNRMLPEGVEVKDGVVARDNMFYNTADVGQIAMAELMQAMSTICQNSDKESDIIDVQVDITVDGDRKTASLISAVPDKKKVKPGETVKFTTTIKPYRKAKETLIIPYTVPVAQPRGTLNLDIRGGGLVPVTTLMLLQQSGVDVVSEGDNKQTTEDKLKKLERAGKNNEIVIAPGQVQKPVSKGAMQEAQQAAMQQSKERVSNLDKLGKKPVTPGETKFATGYIIDNVIHASLGTLKNQLGYRFFLINRSEVVNLDYIRSTNGKELDLIDGRRFCVSRRKQKAFLSLYCAYDDHFLVKEGY